jgi:hypothetical protein
MQQPYHYTLSELKFATWVSHEQIPAEELKTNRRALLDTFFAKSYASMRTSPLTRQIGWGAHYYMQRRIDNDNEV